MVAIKVNVGTITSSLFLMPTIFKAICKAQDLTIQENKKQKELERQIRIAEMKKQAEAEEKQKLQEYRIKLEKICTNLGFGSSEDTLNNCVLLQIQIQATNELCLQNSEASISLLTQYFVQLPCPKD